jgi:hypothetical protein
MTDMLQIAAWCFADSLFLPLFAWALMPLLPRCAATRHRPGNGADQAGLASGFRR